MLPRPATPDDAAGIALVRHAAWQHGYEDVVDPRVLATLDPEEERDRWHRRLAVAADDPGRLHVSVVEHGGRLLGFSAVRARTRETDADPTTGELTAIYVHPIAQGAGLGDRILDAAVTELGALGANRATLRVFAANGHAREFFGRRGWTHDPSAPDEAPDGQAAGPTERWSRDLP